MSEQSDNLAAIDRYIKSAPLLTPDARKLRDEWAGWYDDQGWYARNFDIEVYDHARNLRNQFNLANAITTAQVNAAQRVIQTGLTSEELAGGTTRAMSSGMYDEPLISSATKINLTIGFGLTAIAAVAYLAAEVNPAALIKKFAGSTGGR